MRIAGYIGGIGVLGPGFGNWEEAAALLSGGRYAPAPTVLPAPLLLPPTERRRSGRVVKLALAVASEATERAGVSAASLKSVFSSSGGDGHNCHEICQALAATPREISPTRFSNSVHNAAAGYWSIATGASLASTVLCAFDGSFGAGLLEALVQVAIDREPVLMVAYDTEYPDPLRRKRPVPDAFGVALVLTPSAHPRSAARLEARLGVGTEDSMADAELEALRTSIPAARSLPLLRQLALGTAGLSTLHYLDVAQLIVEIEPCR
jgi:lambda repressor-like predicted transcriptional regulator